MKTVEQQNELMRAYINVLEEKIVVIDIDLNCEIRKEEDQSIFTNETVCLMVENDPQTIEETKELIMQRFERKFHKAKQTNEVIFDHYIDIVYGYHFDSLEDFEKTYDEIKELA